MWALTDGRYSPRPRHVAYLSERLALAAAKGGARLLIEEPPRHGKSLLVSHAFPVWILNRWPTKRVILATHTADFSAHWGRLCRNTIESNADRLTVRVAPDSSAANRWDTTAGGGMYCVGVGGTPVGRGGDLVIVDDPVANSEAAMSEVQREAMWEWWTQSLLTRLEPGAVLIVMHQRWHEDDLAGRILSRSGQKWDRIRFPALAEHDDPLGRKPGEALWPERYDVPALEAIRREVGTRSFSALYQQSPAPADGDLFKREWLDRCRYTSAGRELYKVAGVSVPLSSMRIFTTVDLAVSTKTTADYTVISTFGIVPAGQCLVLNVVRARMEGPDILPAIRREVDLWGSSSVWVERTGFQLALIQDARRQGIPVRELIADKDKVSRAMPLTAAFEGGRIALPLSAPWCDVVERELLAFPVGAHDDTVDTLAYAIGVVLPSLRFGTGASFAVAPPDDAYEPVRAEAEWTPASPWD